MKPTLLTTALAVVLGAAISTVHAAPPENPGPGIAVEDLYLQVEFREGQPPVTIHARTYDNKRPATVILLAIHGFAHNAFCYEPLATALIESKELRHVVDMVVSVSLPGHGASTIPLGDVQFGDLDIMDYVTAVRNTIEALHGEGIYPDAIMGHSMGGLNIMLLQQELLAEGTSLSAAFGIDRAILLAPVAPDPVEAPPFEYDTALPFISSNFLRGTYVDVMPQFLVHFMFTDTNGQLAPDTPGLGQLCSLFSAESLGAWENLVERVFVEPNVLADYNGTKTAILGFSEDNVIPYLVTMDTYAYLTGMTPDDPDSAYTLVENPGAIHDAMISQPDELIPGISKVLSRR